jgi:hypothetical protein
MKPCECCEKRGSTYQQGCAACVARRTARLPKSARPEVYQTFKRIYGDEAMQSFKLLVRLEWDEDQAEAEARLAKQSCAT